MTIGYIDCETSGLDPHHDRIELCQILVDGKVELYYRPSAQDIDKILAKADVWVGHNLAFDLGFMKRPLRPERFEDTFLLSRIKNYTADSHSLDAVAERVLGYNPYADLNKKAMQKGDWANPTPDMIRYAKLDVEILPAIYEALKIDSPVYRFDKASMYVGLCMQQHGLPVLHEQVAEEIDKQTAELKGLLSDLPFNPNSPKQVTQFLGVESSGDAVLAELAADQSAVHSDTAATIRRARTLKKSINFLEKLNAHPRFTGTLHPSARSGRFTSKNENLQNLPRSMKKFIGGPLLVVADYAQLELRTVACIAVDPVLIKLFKNGEDLHAYTAQQLFGPDYTKTERQIAKVYNFSILYGSGAGAIQSILTQQAGIKLPFDEVSKYRKKWLKTYSGIANWQKRGLRAHDNNLPASTPMGRKAVSKRFTDHLSIINQGAGAEVARIALHILSRTLPPKARLINFTHDSYTIEADDLPTAHTAGVLLKEAMEMAWDKAPFQKFGVPMPVEVGIARTWADADSLTNCIEVIA